MRAALTAGRAGPTRPRDAGSAARAALVVLRGYKLLVSPLFTGSCRFSPSCSTYMAQAIREHGALRGAWLGVRRVLRCHPFGGHGFDPVPPSRA
jgi:uncharacterized protein